jgi:hypothetical protein
MLIGMPLKFNTVTLTNSYCFDIFAGHQTNSSVSCVSGLNSHSRAVIQSTSSLEKLSTQYHDATAPKSLVAAFRLPRRSGQNKHERLAQRVCNEAGY